MFSHFSSLPMRVDLDQLGPRRTVINNISVGSRANFFVINYLMDEFVFKKKKIEKLFLVFSSDA